MFEYVHHVHYLVNSCDAMVDYLEKNFGMKPEFVGNNKNGKEARYNVGKTEIQITEPLDPSSNHGKFLAKHGPGVHHVAWAVDGIEQLAKDLAAKGNKVKMGKEGEGARKTHHGYMVCSLDQASSLGVKFQLVGD